MSGCAEQTNLRTLYVCTMYGSSIHTTTGRKPTMGRSEYPSLSTKARHDRPVRWMIFATLMTLVILLSVMIIIWAFIGEPLDETRLFLWMAFLFYPGGGGGVCAMGWTA